jgi:hypothetical protein
MQRKPRPFNSRYDWRRQEIRLLALFLALLYLLGGALIWLFYGQGALLIGWLCMTVSTLFILLVYGVVWLLGKFAGE